VARRIKAWKRFQHFKDRRPPWIKLYRDLLDDLEWHRLSGDDAKLLTMLWLLASESEGELPSDEEIEFRLRMDKRQVFNGMHRLRHWLEHDDTGAISGRYQDGPSETETETETEEEHVAPEDPAATRKAEREARDQERMKTWEAFRASIVSQASNGTGALADHYLDALEGAVEKFYAVRGGAGFTPTRRETVARSLSGIGLDPMLAAVEVYVDLHAGLKDERYFLGIARKNRQLSEAELNADLDRHQAQFRGRGLHAQSQKALL